MTEEVVDGLIAKESLILAFLCFILLLGTCLRRLN